MLTFRLELRQVQEPLLDNSSNSNLDLSSIHSKRREDSSMMLSSSFRMKMIPSKEPEEKLLRCRPNLTRQSQMPMPREPNNKGSTTTKT